MIFKWLRDARYAPGVAQTSVDMACFLPVEIVEHAPKGEIRPALPSSMLEIELAGGHRLRISGSYDPEALARLLRGLPG